MANETVRIADNLMEKIMENNKLKQEKEQYEKNKLEAIISSADLMCYEYDMENHVSTCITEKNIFSLPLVFSNFPECLRASDVVHPDDVELFIQTAYEMDRTCDKKYCEIRMKKEGNYRWYSCIFYPYSETTDRRIGMITVMDISDRMLIVQEYKNRIQALIDANQDSLSIAIINLTDNSFEIVHAVKDIRAISAKSHSLDDLFQLISDTMADEKTKNEFRKIFNRDYLYKCAKNEKYHIEYEHQRYVTSGKIEWMVAVIDLIQNPVTGELTGVYYGKSIHASHMKTLLLKKMLHKDYVMAIVTNCHTDKYNLFYNEIKTVGEVNDDFWTVLPLILQPFCDSGLEENLLRHLSKQKILYKLNHEQDFYWTFDGVYRGEKSRFKLHFSYLDDNNDYIFMSLRNITDQVLLDKLIHDSEHDALTDLYNRSTTFRECRELLDHYPKEQFAMVHFDIKHFRLFNTFFGDDVGDKLLCDIADMFRKMDKDYECWAYGRIEADVFCVFFPINQNKYQKHLKDLLHGLENYRTDFLIEPAIGVYLVTDRNMPIEAMFTRATIAAKQVISGVTNQVLFYTEEMEEQLLSEQMIVNEMQTALQEEQYQVFLQPKYSLDTNKVVGAEALVRWLHPRYGIISPIKFIPLYERNGFIAKLDRYMWEHVCMLLRKWLDEGRAVVPVSVNISRISMYDQSTAAYIQQLVQKYEIDPVYLELELTESAYMDEPEEMTKQLKILQKAGFKILMDDFGSGYSSLNTLREMPVDILKLDMKFLPMDLEDSRGKTILAAMMNMSKALNLTVIAEGVETIKQAEFLRSIGCDFVQGVSLRQTNAGSRV